MAGIFGDYFERQRSPFATAQYRPPQAASFPSPPNPRPLAIPPAQPPVFYSGPDPAAAAPPPSSGPGNIAEGLANGIASGINNHALTLMSLGAGIAQGGVGRGLELATAAAQAERNLQPSRSTTPTFSARSPAAACRLRRRSPPCSTRA